ncbi:MAG: DciA family protein [Gammaproteobacteria bacterium]
MYKTHGKKLTSIIQHQSLKPLIDQAKKIENANLHLKRCLPLPLSDHIIVSNIKGNTLILQANSPVWSTRTHFIATEIINYMRNVTGLAMIEKLKVKVVPSRSQTELPKRGVRPMSKGTSELLNFVATGIKNDDLSEALKNLSQHHTGLDGGD